MAKTITISDELEKLIVAFCDDELNYHINESGCAEEYHHEITEEKLYEMCESYYYL
jgi:hypothetical protein